MNSIEKELQKATGVKPKPKEKRSAYLDRLSDEADKLDERDFDKLSKKAQDWVNEASAEADEAKNRGRDPKIADFDDGGEAFDEVEKPTKKANSDEDEEPAKEETTAAAAEAAGETDEDTDVKTKKGKAAKPTKADKTTEAKAPAKETKKAAPAKAAKANGAKKGNGEIRPGSKNEKLLNLISKSGGATLKEALKATGWKECRGTMRNLAKRVGKEVKVIKAEGKETRYAAV